MASGRKPVKVSVVVGIARLQVDPGGFGAAEATPARLDSTRLSAAARTAAVAWHVAGPGRDLGPPRRPELGQDVLDVAARGLRRDAERVGDLGVGQALADEPRDLELARRSAGATARRPGHGRGPSGRSVSARSASVRRSEPVGRRARPSMPSATASAKRFERTRHWARSSRAQVASHERPWRVPAVRPPPRVRGARRRSRRPPARPALVRGRAPRRRRPGSSRGSSAHSSSQAAASAGRPACVRRPDAGHHERHEQDALTDGGAPGQARRGRARTPDPDRRPAERPRPGPTAAAG